METLASELGITTQYSIKEQISQGTHHPKHLSKTKSMAKDN